MSPTSAAPMVTSEISITPAALPIHISVDSFDQWIANTRLVAEIFKAGRSYLESKGFTEVMTPHIVRASGACENVNTLFEVGVDDNMKWFNGRQAYLAQTGQLYLEALVPKMGKVYCSGPSFRAEPSVDNRHLTEFQMMEIEFPGTFHELLQYIEGFVSHIGHTIASNPHPETLGLSAQNIERLKKSPSVFDRITYDVAIQELQDLGESIEWGDDIASKRERMLVEKHNNNPIFITHYPDPMYDFGKEIEVEKFFNMIPDPQTPGRVLSTDCILPVAGESVGAAARVHDANEMVRRLLNSRMFKRLQTRGGDLSDFDWYLSRIHGDGSVPHAGCGFGMARIIQWVRGSESILDGITFPLNKESLI